MSSVVIPDLAPIILTGVVIVDPSPYVVKSVLVFARTVLSEKDAVGVAPSAVTTS